MSEPRAMNDLDRGAVAALALLLRGQDYQTGDESLEESADNLSSAIELLGLPTVIANHRKFELEFELEEFGDGEAADLPPLLAELIGTPRSILADPET